LNAVDSLKSRPLAIQQEAPVMRHIVAEALFSLPNMI